MNKAASHVKAVLSALAHHRLGGTPTVRMTWGQHCLFTGQCVGRRTRRMRVFCLVHEVCPWRTVKYRLPMDGVDLLFPRPSHTNGFGAPKPFPTPIPSKMFQKTRVSRCRGCKVGNRHGICFIYEKLNAVIFACLDARTSSTVF